LLTDSQATSIFVSDAEVNLASWKLKYWPGEQDPNIIGNHADPEGDGLDNLLEYGLGTDPTLPDVQGLPALDSIEEQGKNYLTLTYLKRTDDPHLQFKVIASNSLKNPDAHWDLQNVVLPVDQVGVPAGLERVRVRDSIAIEDGPVRRFMKLQVNLP
jgi:hypothetical protein